MTENTLYLDWACDALDTEAEGLRETAVALDHDFVRAAEALLYCRGRVVITGMGKSGHTGHKMAATMASTGTLAFFVHPAETTHGNLGMIVGHDAAIAISNSGEGDGTVVIIPVPKCKNITLICITVHPTSTMARHADIHITAVVSKEACPLGLASTPSTTAVMALGDALAVVLLRARALTPDDFALSHPVGSLGKRLLLRVADIIRKGEILSAVLLGMSLKEVTVRINEKGLGMLAVTDAEGRLKGVFADSDLRRLFQERDSFADLKVDDITHASPKTTSVDRLATEVLKVMQSGHVNGLLVVEKNGALIGTLNIHGLLVARIV